MILKNGLSRHLVKNDMLLPNFFLFYKLNSSCLYTAYNFYLHKIVFRIFII
jgi:hypothetical protein